MMVILIIILMMVVTIIIIIMLLLKRFQWCHFSEISNKIDRKPRDSTDHDIIARRLQITGSSFFNHPTSERSVNCHRFLPNDPENDRRGEESSTYPQNCPK